MLMDAAFTFAILDNAEGWYYNLWNHQTAEERADAVAEWEETVATRAEEYAAAKPAAEEKTEEDAAEEEGEEGEEGAEEGEEGEEEAAEEE
jgi:outer membrane biosynthesis protein TonB